MSAFSTITNTNKSSSIALQAAQNAVSKATIGTLKDVNSQGAQDGQVLLYNSSDEKWEAKSLTSVPTLIPQNIEDLKDVSTTDPTDGQVLKFVNSTGLWTPGATGALSADLGDLGDVDVTTLPKYNGANLQFDGANWITAPSDAITIWVAAEANGGSNDNSGLLTGAAVADMPTAFQRALQKGSVVSSKINLKLAAVPWDTSTRNLYNTNLLNGPSFTTFNINGSSQDFTAADGGGTSRTTGIALTGYAITNSGQTISNGWACTAFPTTIHWGEVTVDGATRTIPVMVDDQTQNEGIRVYMAYWKWAGTGFASTPTFTQRALTDSTTMTHSASFNGPMSFTNLIVKGPDSGELKFLNNVSMQYVELSSTTPTQITNITYEGQHNQCRYCRFTDLKFSCKGTTGMPENDTKTTFVNCIFYNCEFVEAENISFLGCIFYKNPTLFNIRAVRVNFDICTFIYSHGSGGAALAHLGASMLIMINSVMDLQQYASGHNPLTKPVFIIAEHANTTIRNSSVLDGVLNTTATGGVQDPYLDLCAFAIVEDNADFKADGVTITDTGVGDYPIYIVRNMAKLFITEGQYVTNIHTLVAAGSGSSLLINSLVDKIECKDCIVADRSSINLQDITIKTGATYLMTGNFLTTTSCNVVGGGASAITGIWVDSSHTDTKNFISDHNSDITLELVAEGSVMDMYGKLILSGTNLNMKVKNNGTKNKINLVNGTTNAGSVLIGRHTNANIHDVSFQNTHVTDGGAIDASLGSNISLIYGNFQGGKPNHIQCLDGITLSASFSSHIYLEGIIGSIRNTAEDQFTISCNGKSHISIVSTVSVAQAASWKTVIERNNAGTSTAEIISVLDGSSLSIINNGAEKLATAGAGAINIAAPELLLKGKSTNDGLGPIVIADNSSMSINLCKITFRKLNGPSKIHSGSKFSAMQCVMVDDSASAERLQYFSAVDSEIAINGLGELTVLYLPTMVVQAKDDANQGVIVGSNSKIIYADMDVGNLVAVGTNQVLIHANNGSLVSYLNPKKTANNGFSTGVQLRSNSKCVFKDAGADQLTYTQAILLGVLAGANTNKQRKLVDMGDGTTIIPTLAVGVTGDFSAFQTYIDAAEGCVATIAI